MTQAEREAIAARVDANPRIGEHCEGAVDAALQQAGIALAQLVILTMGEGMPKADAEIIAIDSFKNALVTNVLWRVEDALTKVPEGEAA